MESDNVRRASNGFFGYVSVMHAVPNAPNVDVYANGNLIVSNLEYGKYTKYLRIPAQTYDINIYVAGTTDNPVLSRMLTLGRNEIFTVAAVGTLDTIDLLAIRDADVPRVPDKALVRFVHLSPNAPAVDITLPDGTVIFEDISFRQVTEYVPLEDMVYTLQVRLAGTDTVALTVPRVDVRENNYYSIYAIGLVGGQPALDALLVRDGNVR
ncbi:hypothetical protein lbkm_1810 [Lachnospiraceae bacterium KM106-2]|nr:hypothetical protein lbkm_1810 [Lachnospiraceae bacterium KM106-2]